MRRFCLFCLSALVALAASACGRETAATTTITTPVVQLPFDAGSLLTQIDPPDAFGDILAIGDRILHLDESMVVYREDGGTTVIADGETFRFPSVFFAADDPSRWFLGFDSATRTLYYYEDVGTSRTSLEYVSLTGIDDEDPAFIGYSETLKFRSASFTVTGNTIRDFRGTTLFANGETIAFPASIPGDPLRFYTYHRARDTAERGCTIKTYDGFDAAPSDIQTVHDTYTCGEVVATTRTQVAIEILRYSTVKGYALVDASGTVHSFLFEDYLPTGASVGFDSAKVATSTFRYDAPRFTYEDDEDVTHTVFTDLDFSYVIDLTDWERYRYADDGHRVLSDDRIFDPDWVRLATVEPSPDSVMTPNIERLGDTLLFTDYTLGDDLEYDFRTTVFDFRTHALAGIEGIFVGFDGDAFVADTGDDVIVYDRSTWTALMTYPDRGFAMLSNGFLFLTAGTEMTIVELATGTSATLTIECAFPYSWTTYGYVLSYGGGYYLLG